MREYHTEGKFEVAEPRWTWCERWQRTWHTWLLPAWGIGVFVFYVVPPYPPVWSIRLVGGALLAAYCAHTWMLGTNALWHKKMCDNLMDTWGKLLQRVSREAFEIGRQVGREETLREDKPWLH